MSRSALACAAPDPVDQSLRDLLAAGAYLLLVPGDRLLLTSKSMEGWVVAARAFMESEPRTNG